MAQAYRRANGTPDDAKLVTNIYGHLCEKQLRIGQRTHLSGKYEDTTIQGIKCGWPVIIMQSQTHTKHPNENTYKTKWKMSRNKEAVKFKQKMEMVNNVNHQDDVSDQSS